MLTPRQIRVFGAFLKKPYQDLTYRDIKTAAKERSNSTIQQALAKFRAEGLVHTRKVAHVTLYRPNLNNPAVLAHFTLLAAERLPAPAHLTLDLIRQETKDTPFVSTVIFGSYADTPKKGSDLDVALFVRDAKDKRACELSLKAVQDKTPLPLDAHVFTNDEMLQMLLEARENLGKQIAAKHLAFHNPAIFYAIVQEGIDRGFKIMY